MASNKKLKVATVWLNGCSGCHMSFLDMDELLLKIAEVADLVYSPLVDLKEFPPDVDLTIVEGAVGNEEDLHKIKMVRERSKLVMALGDCAVTGNVPAMRNPFAKQDCYDRAYQENAATNQQTPNKNIPDLLPQELPVREVVKVDVFLPGCPPNASLIYAALAELVQGKIPEVQTHFG